MIEHDVIGIKYFSYNIFEPYLNLTSVVTTRRRGRSKGAYASLNLGLHVGDDPDAVLENRAIVGQILGFEPEAFTVASQVHGANVLVVGSDDEGRGAIVEDDALPGADAMISRAPLCYVRNCLRWAIHSLKPDEREVHNQSRPE